MKGFGEGQNGHYQCAELRDMGKEIPFYKLYYGTLINYLGVWSNMFDTEANIHEYQS